MSKSLMSGEIFIGVYNLVSLLPAAVCGPMSVFKGKGPHSMRAVIGLPRNNLNRIAFKTFGH